MHARKRSLERKLTSNLKNVVEVIEKNDSEYSHGWTGTYRGILKNRRIVQLTNSNINLN